MTTAPDLKARFLELLPTAKPAECLQVTQPASDLTPSDHQDESRGRGADLLLPLFLNDPLYLGDDGNGYLLRRGKLYPLDSKNRETMEDFRWAGLEFTGKAPAKEAVATVIDLLSAKSRQDGEPLELFNRCGERNGVFCYDLGGGLATEITPTGEWSIIPAPVWLRQMKHQQAHPKPMKDGDPWQFFKFEGVKRIV